MKSILVVSSDQSAHLAIKACFWKDYGIEFAASRTVALELNKTKRYEFIFIDIASISPSGNEIKPEFVDYKKELQPFFTNYPTVLLIVLTPPNRVREAVYAVKSGASNYLTYPLVNEEVKYITDTLLETQRRDSELVYLRKHILRDYDDPDAITRTSSPSMADAVEKMRSVASTKTTVLMLGETGVGKGVMARLIHKWSDRSKAPFIAVHCGAIPETLIESELFGHEKGAFTGAHRRKLGKFELAKGGTIFLDEIGTITPASQIKLLQVLQEKSFSRVGGEITVDADVRIIAATNDDLTELIESGKFRKDLYFRLSVFPIKIPPLSERIEDLPFLIENIIARLNNVTSKNIRGVEPAVMKSLTAYDWPGNIRELENVVERAFLLEHGDILTKAGFAAELVNRPAIPEMPAEKLDLGKSLGEVRRDAADQAEISYLDSLLRKFSGRINLTAKSAGLTTRQINKLMTKHNLNKANYKKKPSRSAKIIRLTLPPQPANPASGATTPHIAATTLGMAGMALSSGTITTIE